MLPVQKDCFLYTNLDNVVITALKRCEDGSGDLIVRLYETKGIDSSRGYIMSKLFDTGTISANTKSKHSVLTEKLT